MKHTESSHTKQHGLSKSNKASLSSFSDNAKKIENVLILQGGGSLGAFGCGVYKNLIKNNIEIDIVAGTSIGGVNAAIIAGSKNKKHPEQALEDFWLELTDGYVNLDYVPTPLFANLEYLKAKSHFNIESAFQQNYDESKSKLHDYGSKSLKAFLSSAIFGNTKMFKPRWCLEYAGTDLDYFHPERWTYLYDHSLLAKTLENYVDFEELKPNGNPNSRLIMTAVNVLTSEPLIFDSAVEDISVKHVLATCGYPLYYFPWVEVKNGVYAWDGGLLSNTPLREVIEASPVNDKRIFLVENYPKKIMKLPENLSEVFHRTRDIIFCDKTLSTVKVSKVITRYLEYIDELYKLVEDHVDASKVDKVQLDKIRVKYKKYKQETGAEIKAIYYISRDEVVHSIYENANFSPEAIKNLIKEGELKANEICGR